jgi:hypothetical protein
MRQLKIKKAENHKKDENLIKKLKSLPKPSEDTSEEERLAYAKMQFKARTGLEEGAKVHYIGINDLQVEFLRNKYADPRGKLDFETIYEIEHITIARSYTIVKLVGFSEEKFIAGIFKAIDIHH